MPLNKFTGLRDFLTIWAGQLVSSTGSRMSSFALGIWVLHTTNSTGHFAMTFVAMTIPALGVSLIAGALVDRWDRRQTMIGCGLLSAINMFALTGLAASGHLKLWQIYLSVGIGSLFDAFRVPAFSASIPLLAVREQLPRVNGIAQSGNATAEIIGPLLAGALFGWISLSGILAIDALTFLAGVASLGIARIPRPTPAGGQIRPGLLREAAIGWRYVQARTGLVGLLSIFGANNFVFSIARVIIAPMVLSFTDAAHLGMQYATSASGLLIGGVAMTLWGGPRKRINGVLIFSALGGICAAAHGLRPSFVLIASSGFVLFLMLPIIAASNSSLWQTKVPADLQGRCFAIQRATFYGSTVVGYFLAGPLSERVFEPLLAKGGPLAGSVGAIIGVGPGRGLGLLFIILGIVMTLTAVIAYSMPAIRNLDELADAFALPRKAVAVATKPQAEVAEDGKEQIYGFSREVLPEGGESV